jgi:hypothetical protein
MDALAIPLLCGQKHLSPPSRNRGAGAAKGVARRRVQVHHAGVVAPATGGEKHVQWIWKTPPHAAYCDGGDSGRSGALAVRRYRPGSDTAQHHTGDLGLLLDAERPASGHRRRGRCHLPEQRAQLDVEPDRAPRSRRPRRAVRTRWPPWTTGSTGSTGSQGADGRHRSAGTAGSARNDQPSRGTACPDTEHRSVQRNLRWADLLERKARQWWLPAAAQRRPDSRELHRAGFQPGPRLRREHPEPQRCGDCPWRCCAHVGDVHMT